MNLEITREQLASRKLFIATPMYGGFSHGMYAKSCLDLQGMCQQFGIESRFSFIFNESLITRARNYLCDEFLRSGYSHLLFIDADIHFDPRDVLTLLAMDKDIVGAPYPKKSIKWWAIKEAIVRSLNWKGVTELAQGSNPTPADLAKSAEENSIKPEELEKLVGDYVFNAVAGTGQFNIGEPIEVMEIGTGYMMVKKEVFERYMVQYPEYRYKPDHIGQAHFDGSRYIHAFFDCLIDRKRSINVDGVAKEVGGSDRYLSEDYTFCQNWRNMGGKVWLCPWMRTHHIGTYAFTGDMPAVANHLGKL